MNINDLVKKYQSNRENYLKTEYNESQLRTDFLDPFFILLGWDISNEKAKPSNEREVLVEESLKKDANSNSKKPDYTFRLFSERKFFLEAKKPTVKIEKEDTPAKQIRRYGFTAKLKISVLSNFEYLAIYDCSQKVSISDTSTTGRIKLYHYTEYEKYFEEIKQLLSYQSVYSGTFDKKWKNINKQISLSSIDNLFLNQINSWRLLLGKEIYKHKTDISEEELNDTVQRYINSIIFLRVCEDRNIETYKTLLNFATQDDFKALIQKFKNADKIYNSGLFNHNFIGDFISNNSSAFWQIIKQLYFPESIYSFAVFSSDILGNIYEIFLGEQLEIENKQIILKKKAENIDRDIVTTPNYIIKDILRQTVSEFCKGKTDTEILNSKFADIACGSGTFLLETYQLLHDILVDYYLINDKAKLVQTGINNYKLSFSIKKQLLTQCIWGIDKDYNAVEACKFGLLLKLLEGENNSSISAPILPNIDKNISYGNSLLSFDDVSETEYDEINPFDFGQTRFDVIIGNPPYMTTKHIKEFTPLELPLYKNEYISAYKQFDKYFLFIERAISLLKPNAYLGYIIPSKFMKVASGKALRNLLQKRQLVKNIISFGANQIFQDKTTYTCLLILQNKRQEKMSYFEAQDLNAWKTRNIKTENFDTITFNKLNSNIWILISKDLKPIYNKINLQSISLKDLIGAKNIYNGIQTSANKIYVNKAIKTDNKFVYFKKDNVDWKIEKELTRPYYETVKTGDNFSTYRPFNSNSFVVYPYIKNNNKIEFVEIEKMKKYYPNTFNFLQTYKKDLSNPKRDIQPKPETVNEWYRYGRHQSLDKCDVSAKIIVGVLSQGNKYAIDYHGTLISSGGTAGYCMITLPEDFNYSIYYIQALLNSKYLEWFSSLNGEVFRGGYIARGTKVLNNLPIRKIDFDNEQDKNLHDNIVNYQKKLINLQGNIDENYNNLRKKELFQRQFDQKKKELDDLLKKLYNLGEDDNKIPLIGELYAAN